VQVVWREAILPLQEVELDPANGPIIEQLHARFNARRYRLDVSQAPLMRLVYARDPAWIGWWGFCCSIIWPWTTSPSK
jgi:arthrofactin-type cyclic lipopeptide synthetase A